MHKRDPVAGVQREAEGDEGKKMETKAWGIELPEPFLIIIYPSFMAHQ